MQYLIYFAVATPLLLGWLFWETAGAPPPPPMFHSFADTVHDRAVLRRQAEAALRARAARKKAARKQAVLARAEQAPPQQQATRVSPPRFERTARANRDRDIRLR
jgi:hypothetical protein